MKKNTGSSMKLGSFLSPGTPNYTDKGIEIQKGWSSERVMLQAASSSRRSTQFSSGRTMPSKWDDAERWISSPIVGQSNSRSSCSQVLRRPKSKSGPIVPPGAGYYSNYSPVAIPLRQGLLVRNLVVGSPFTTGVLAPDALSVHHFDGHDAVFTPNFDIGNVMHSSGSVFHHNGVAVSSMNSPPNWSELLCDLYSPNSQDENRDGTKNEETAMSPCSKLDKGTQMSPLETDNDEHSSPKSSPASAGDPKNGHYTKLEVRDVEVDSQATVARRSKIRATKLDPPHGKDLKETSTEVQACSSLDIVESTLDITKIEREEAKLVAWESLQKAKAEAAILKLEMKLEKKRSSSMEKILSKLRRAQMKAEKMRSLRISVQQQEGSNSKKPRKVFSLIPKYFEIWSPSRCFATHSP